MNLSEFKTSLQAQPGLTVSIALPDGRRVPSHYHVTEVGHIAKKFVDCGGTFRASEACLLQTWVGSTNDDGHRLTAGKLALILDLANPILSGGDLPVEVEYEDGAISQFPVEAIATLGGELRLQLGRKHTDCLAKELCGATAGDGDDNGCCG